VVALEYDFFTRQFINIPEIFEAFSKTHPPGYITAYYTNIIRAQYTKAGFNFFRVIFPSSAKFIHGFVNTEG
jgi:hypothetical protein